MKLIAKREELTLPDEEMGHPTSWTYINIYDMDGNLLSRSGRNHFEGHIMHIYDGLIFTSERYSDVCVTVESLTAWFEKKEFGGPHEVERNTRLMKLVMKLNVEGDTESLEFIQTMLENDTPSMRRSFKIMTQSTPLSNFFGIKNMSETKN